MNRNKYRQLISGASHQSLLFLYSNKGKYLIRFSVKKNLDKTSFVQFINNARFALLFICMFCFSAHTNKVLSYTLTGSGNLSLNNEMVSLNEYNVLHPFTEHFSLRNYLSNTPVNYKRNLLQKQDGFRGEPLTKCFFEIILRHEEKRHIFFNKGKICDFIYFHPTDDKVLGNVNLYKKKIKSEPNNQSFFSFNEQLNHN